MKRSLLFSFSLLLFMNTLAQYKAGLKYYNRFDYYKAITKFKKVKPGNKNRADALVKMADCYRMVRDFKNSAIHYKMAIEAGAVEPITHYNYGLALKSTNQYEEALKEFSIYLNANPADSKAKNATRSCTEMKAALSLPQEYKTTNLARINTKNSELCPVVFDKGLAYVSLPKTDWVNIDKFLDDGPPQLAMYYAPMQNDTAFSKTQRLSKKLNSDLHDGPLCFSSDQNTLFFTRVENLGKRKKGDFINQPKIFYSTRSGSGWSKPLGLPFNSNEYCVAHPCISADGNYLYFSCNMPGGNGGMDIWVSKKNGETWEQPVNLGPDINTSGNEEFPYLRADGILFFSSDGLPGFGGLDIFSAKQIEGKWILNRNEGTGINSFADDFGICFTDIKKGYVSSNRDGGMGSDDIYSFTYSPASVTVEGTVLLNRNINNPAKNVQVFLEDEACNHINSSKTNDNGYFKFENLKPGIYKIKLDEKDLNLKKAKRYYYADTKGAILRVTVVNEKGEKHVFTNLPADPNALPDLGDNDIALAGTLLYGQNPSNPIPNATILLKDENDETIDQATTNFFGSFAFQKAYSDENYSIEVMPPTGMKIPLNTRIILTNRNGKEIRVIRAEKSGKYKFAHLASDKTNLQDMKVNESDLVMDLSGKILDPDKKKLPGARVSILNDKGDTLFVNTTDINGAFNFKKLEALKDYTLAVDDNEKTKGFDKLYVADPEERIIKALVKDFKNGFQYKILASEKTALKNIYVDDPWLDILNFGGKETTIQENVYYASGEYKLSPAGMNILDKVILVLKSNPAISIEIGSHTDARGNDDFNLNLSKKRAMFGADYAISHGIKAIRVKGIGYGETKIINRCLNNVNCNDEEHAKNRRTEFRIINTK